MEAGGILEFNQIFCLGRTDIIVYDVIIVFAVVAARASEQMK